MKKLKNSFQHEAFRAILSDQEQKDKVIKKLSETEWIRNILIARLQTKGIITETTDDLKQKIQNNRAHILKLSYEFNCPIIPERSIDNGVINFYYLFILNRLNPEQIQLMQEVALREIDYKERVEKISRNALNRLCQSFTNNNILPAGHERVKEITETERRLALALSI